MVEQLEVYILTDGQVWEDFPDPGNTQPHADGTLNTTQQKEDMEELWTGAQGVYSLQIAIQTAIIDTLNDAVPE